MSKTYLIIAGHGENADSTFDPGATGFITKGEHRYFEEDFYTALNKFLPEDHNVVLFSDYNVYDYGDLVSLANSYGSDTVVLEMHYDAASPAATGGHVIVHADYEPDSLDLEIRDIIEEHIGVRYNHKGHVGISGRDNLYNCNVAADGNINYRLIELGFGTSETDANVMLNNVDAIAKDFVQTITGNARDVAVETKDVSVDKAEPLNIEGKTIDELARDVMQGMYGNGADRKEALGDKYDAVQARVEELTGTSTAPAADTKAYPLPTSGTYSVTDPGNTYNEGTLAIQQALCAVYFYPDKGAENDGADGYYGGKTEDAVSRFQTIHVPGQVDGIAGANTLAALDREANGSAAASTKSYGGGKRFNLPTSGTYSVEDPGNTYNADVLTIQLALSAVYFYPNKGAINNGCDGYFGGNTEDAVMRFQSVYTPNQVDGIVGANTLAALDEQANQ